MNLELLWIILAATGGYIASIYTWPAIRATVLGVEAEAKLLRDRATAIINAARGR